MLAAHRVRRRRGYCCAPASPYAKGLGLGLMIGWAVTSLFTVGFCTGINPEMYTLR